MLVKCDICNRQFHSCAVHKCPHPRAETKNIRYVCMYCCQKSCKHSEKVIMQFSNGHKCTYKGEE